MERFLAVDMCTPRITPIIEKLVSATNGLPSSDVWLNPSLRLIKLCGP